MCYCLYAFQHFRPFFFLSAHCFVVPGTFTVGPHSVFLIYLMFCAMFCVFATLCWSTYASQGSRFTKKNQTALKNGWEEICFSSHIALNWALWYQKLLDDLVLADVASRKVVQDYLVRCLGEKIPGGAACGGHSFCYNPEKRSCR